MARAGLSDVVDLSSRLPLRTARASCRLALNPGHPGDHHLADDGEPVAAVTLDDSRRTTVRSRWSRSMSRGPSRWCSPVRAADREHRPALFIEIDGPSLGRLGFSPA